jgi:MFS family permease
MNKRFGWGWTQVFVAFLIQGIGSGSLMYAYSVVVVPFADTFAPSRMTLMLGMTFMILGSGLLSPWLGVAIDRKPLRLLLGGAILAVATGFLLLSLTTAIWQMPAVYLLCMSFGLVLLGPLAASTLVSRWFLRRRGLALGIAAMGTSFGGFLFPPLIQWLVDTLEWRAAFRVLAVVIAALVLPVWLLTVDRPGDKGLHPDGLREAPGAAGEAGDLVFSSTNAIIRNRSFWVVAAIVSVLFAAFTATLGNLVPFALDAGVSADRGALLISNIALMAIPGTLIFGWLADRMDVRMALAMVIAVVAGGLACLFGEPSYARMVAGSLLVGLGGGGMIPVWSALLAGVFGPANYGRVMGLMNPVLMPFNLLAPPLAGWVQDVAGSYHWAFVLFAGLMLASLALVPLIEKR